MANPINNLLGINAGANSQGSFQINPQMLQQMKQLMGVLNAPQNPNAIIENLAQRNPQIRQVIEMCGGKDPKAVFYEMCKQRGVNPDDILNQLR